MGSIGVSLITLTPEVKAQINRDPNFGVAVGEESGVLVVKVVPRSPAATVGFLRGDVIRTISGKTVTTSEQVKQIVRQSSFGDQLQVEISRNGEVLSLSVSTGKATVQYYPE
jgi:S1-C subfamily serine protease